MNLKSEEILYYINYLEKQIKTAKSKSLKDKYTEQKNTLIYLLFKNK